MLKSTSLHLNFVYQMDPYFNGLNPAAITHKLPPAPKKHSFNANTIW